MISFTATTTLNTDVAKRIQAALHRAVDDAVQVGWFGGRKHPDSFNKESESTIAGVVSRNEFGEKSNLDAGETGVPKRPFVRPVVQVRTVDDQIRFLKAGTRSIFTGKNTMRANQQKLGRHIIKELQSAIDNQTFHGKKSNSPKTEAHKGHARPLQGKTGLIRNTIKYRIAPKDNTDVWTPS